MNERQKVTKYPKLDVTLIQWVNKTETPLTQKDIYKDTVFSLTEKCYLEMQMGKTEFVRQLNQVLSEFRKIAL